MFFASLQLILRRSLAHWRLLSAVVVGVLLAVSIMSATVVYFGALRDLALDHDFEGRSPGSLDVAVDGKQSPVNVVEDRQLMSLVEGVLDSRLGWFSSGVEKGIRSDTFFTANPGDTIPPESSDNRRAAFIVLERVKERAVITAGRWPDPAPLPPGDGMLIVDAAIPGTVAAQFDLQVGDAFETAPFWDAAHDRIRARVVGVYERADPDALFWRVYDDGLGFADTSFRFATFVVPRETLLKAIGPYFPKLKAEYHWLVDTDPEAIRASASDRAQAGLESVRTRLRPDLDGFRMQTSLGGVLSRFDRRLFFNKVPMFVVMVLIVLVILYYVSTIAGLLVDAQREEIGLLRTRGATSRQIILVYAVEAFVLTALAIPLGPYIAATAIGAVGVVPVFADLNSGSPLPVEITASVFQLSALGGALSLLSLLIPSLRAARVGLLQHRQSLARPPRLPAFQRYYLDLVVLGVVLFLFWQLQQRGSFVATRLFGEETVNQVVLAVPALFLVAAGVVLLRIFPISMEVLGRLLSSRPLSRVASPAMVLGLWQMARNPAHYARLSLLLILTAGLGVFAASFRGSLEKSFDDRVLYETGADVRVTGIRFPPEDRGRSALAEERIREIPGVTEASPFVRRRGSLLSRFGRTFQYLAVDPRTAADVAWTRPDFASGPIGEVMRQLDLPDVSGIFIPEDAKQLYARVRPLQSYQNVNLLARISDAKSRMFTLNLGTMTPHSANTEFRCPRRESPDDPPPWCTMAGSLGLLRYQSPSPAPPFKLEFLSVAKLNDVDGSGGLAPGAFFLDELGVQLGDGSSAVLEDFEDLTKWGALGTTLNDFGATITRVRDERGAPVPGLARFSWGAASLRQLQGVLAGKLRQPVPVLASPEFLELSNFQVGDEVEVFLDDREVLIRIRDILDFFPTLDPNQAPFVVADIRSTWLALGVDQLGAARRVDEIWAAGEGPEIRDDIDEAVDRLRIPHRDVIVRADLLGRTNLDPLSAAGWRALLVIAFVAVLVVSAIGFLVHAQVTFRGRRTELALLRATGLSMKQLLGLVFLEQVVVLGAAFAIGVFMGARLGETIMPFIGTAGEGLRTVPPMVQQVDWSSFSVAFGFVAAAFMLVIGTLLVSVYRMSVHRVLRLGER